MAVTGHITNDINQSILNIWTPDGEMHILLGVGDKEVSGETEPGAWLATATHTPGATLAATDGVVAIAGSDDGVGGELVPILVDALGRLVVSLTAASGLLTDQSGTIADAATSQEICAANTNRKYFLFQNHSDSDMWIDFGVAAVAGQPSIKVEAGTGFTMEAGFVSTQAVNVICADDAKDFTAKEG